MRIAALRALLLLAGIHLAMGPGACAAGPDPRTEPRTIRGVVRVVGNEPLTRVVVTSPGDEAGGVGRVDYLVTGPLEAELRRSHQGRTVTLEGSDCASPSPLFRNCFAPDRVLGSEESR